MTPNNEEQRKTFRGSRNESLSVKSRSNKSNNLSCNVWSILANNQFLIANNSNNPTPIEKESLRGNIWTLKTSLRLESYPMQRLKWRGFGENQLRWINIFCDMSYWTKKVLIPPLVLFFSMTLPLYTGQIIGSRKGFFHVPFTFIVMLFWNIFVLLLFQKQKKRPEG